MKINTEIKVIVGIIIVCVLILGAFVWFGPRGNSAVVDQDLLIKTTSQMTGQIGAKVTLVEFADYQCPACATLSPYIKEIVDFYKNNPDFNFIYRHFPLSQHANAIISAEAAEAVGAEGKFFDMGSLLYKNQTEWSGVSDPTDLFVSYAATLGLDTIKFRKELVENKYEALVRADLADAVSLRLNKTPTLFLNGQEVTDLGTLKTQIELLLAK